MLSPKTLYKLDIPKTNFKPMKIMTIIPLMGFLLFTACGESDNKEPEPIPPATEGTQFIAGHTTAREEVLRKIPTTYINQARTTLHVAYQHTSHGTHVTYGLYGLPDFKTGDKELFGITHNDPQNNKLDFRDNVIASYANGVADLSTNETAFEEGTRKFLDDPANANINVVMWSWCSITNHNVAGNYLPGMQRLINEYGKDGTKVLSGKRKTPVTFIFMTGHAEANSNIGNGKPKNQADLIIDFCEKNKQYCLDYYSIDTHDMENNYWDDAGDDGDSAKGGKFYANWQSANAKGQYWFENKSRPGGSVTYGAHNTQHITANRKAYAMWWILARIAGWDGETE